MQFARVLNREGRIGLIVAIGALALLWAAVGLAANGPDAKPAPSKAVAFVNNQEIPREVLASECLRQYGKEVLGGVINRMLISAECKRLNVTVADKEIDEEIDRMSSKFNLPREQWLKLLQDERNIKPQQYATDVVWPMLALRKIAGERLTVSAEELQKEFESQFGAAIRARMIVTNTAEEAQQLHAAAVAKPDEFGNLAKDHSRDPNSASMKGIVQPIRRHAGQPEIEQAAFTMADGAISPPIKVGNQFVILKREQVIPPVNISMEQAKPRLEELIRERKMRGVANDVFAELKKRSQVKEVFGDPLLSQQFPNAAAVIDGRELSVGELAAACIERHGEEVLETIISRRLLEQACQRDKVTITEQDMNAEISHVASVNMKPKADGTPDVEGWLQFVTQRQNVTADDYRSDIIWPSVALRKLVANQIQVTEEDVKKGFEANYGPRVRCRAIVLTNPRIAQRVWEMARKNSTVEAFGELATQYSVEPSSRALQGEVPPIRKHGGQPILEKEAFMLKPGELSGIIQAGDKYIILLCEGLTDPVQVDFASVQNILLESSRC